jgi:hypothetical protein
MLRSIVRVVRVLILSGIIAAALAYFFPSVFHPPSLY